MLSIEPNYKLNMRSLIEFLCNLESDAIFELRNTKRV